MSIEVKTFCPLGSKCEEVKDGAIHRCAWYAMVRGKNENTGEEIDDWGCSMNWMPYLLIENSKRQRDTGKEIETLRNDMAKANEMGLQVLLESGMTPQIPQIPMPPVDPRLINP